MSKKEEILRCAQKEKPGDLTTDFRLAAVAFIADHVLAPITSGGG